MHTAPSDPIAPVQDVCKEREGEVIKGRERTGREAEEKRRVREKQKREKKRAAKRKKKREGRDLALWQHGGEKSFACARFCGHRGTCAD